MQLGDIFDDESFDIFTAGIEVDRVEIDSRHCEFPSLFFALMGTSADGAKFAAHAVDHGAVAIVSPHDVKAPVPVVVIPESRIYGALTHASATLSGHPEDGVELVGVTGTNGKTSVTSLVADLSRALGWNGASIGTLTNERTTPAAPELYRTLAKVRSGFVAGRDTSVVALEVSSHAIDQHRVEGTRFSVVAFTNLSHDHLDYHLTMDAYFAAKARLFEADYSSRAVIWVDDAYGAKLAQSTTLSVTPVRRSDATDVVSTLGGTIFFWRGHLVNTTLIGDYNIDNALMAMTIVSQLGASDAAVSGAMSNVSAIPGRFEVVHRGQFTVVVDYAHTPQGLERLLTSVRSLGAQRILTVFGCGGERDIEKRPVMGRVAAQFSDLTFVTSDNPRHESPDAIIDAIVAGVEVSRGVVREADRRQAIERAVREAEAGDVVVVAGKGHETTQIFGDHVVHFDDREVVREILKELSC